MADLALDIWLTAHDSFSGVFQKMGVELDGMRGKIGLAAGAFGVLAGGALAESVKQAADWQTTISQVAANTNMTTAQMNQMSATIKRMASESSAPMEDLARAYEHIGNFGYRGADATNILHAAMESAVSTGANTAEVANMLANVMKEYGLQTNRAGDAINVMHTAAAMGNMRLSEFVEYGGRAIGIAAGLGIPLQQVSAAMAAMTQHGEDAARAGTDIAGLLNHIVSPAKHARDELAYLSHVTGIDLVHDFSVAGLRAKGLAGVLADVQKATHGNKELIDQLVPAIHGGYAAFMLTNQGAADYTRILSALNDTMSGKTNPTAEAYARTQQTVAFQLGVLKNNLQLMAISIGEAVLPALNRLLGAVVPVVRGIADWTSKHSGLVAGLLAGVAVVGTLVGAILVLGPVIAALASPIGIVVVAIGAAVAGIVALVSSSSGIRDVLAGIWSKIADDAGALWSWLTGIWNGISGDAMLLWEDLGSWLNQTWTGIVSAATPIWNALVGTLKFIWDTLRGDSKAATADLQLLPPSWRATAQALAQVFGDMEHTIALVWDLVVGDAKDAQKNLDALSPGWKKVVQTVGDLLGGLGKAGKSAMEGLGKVLKEGFDHLVKPVLGALGKEWQRFTKEAGPLLGAALHNLSKLLGAAMAPVIAALAGAWKGFWQGGAQKMLQDGMTLIATAIKAALHIVEDALVFVLAVLALRWDVAWKKLKDIVGTTLGGIRDVLIGSAKVLADAAGAIIHAIEGVFTGLYGWLNDNLLKPALHWGETIMKNIAEGIKKAAQGALDAMKDFAKKLLKLIPHLSPAEEGPLSAMPNFHYIGDAMRAAIPHVHAAATDLMSAAGMSGGSLGLEVGASGHVGGAGAAGTAGSFNAGHTVTIAPNITIQGGTFTDKQGVRDLAKAVSEEIMHSVRMQGGLLPQM